MRTAEFKWGDISQRQRTILSWWTNNSPFADFNGIIADGAIRSGKTTVMAFSFVLWGMETFNNQNFALCGKTVGSLRRNVVSILKRQLSARGYFVQDKRSENLLIVTKAKTQNYFYVFGGKDESSQDLIQGITLAGCFFDEVALMPQSFVNQATARCSVDGSKFWFNCNPSSPQHWFYCDWIKNCKRRKMLYLHFTMYDNLTLSAQIRERYEAQYAGVFYQRYILGLWVMAEGLIFDMFDRKVHVCKDIETEGEYFVSADFGIQNATVFLLWRKEKGSDRWVCLREYYYSGRDNKIQKTVEELAEGFKSILPVDHYGAVIKPKQTIIDPSAAALIAQLRKEGFHVVPAINDVLDGISNVSTMLHQGRLLIDDSCKNTINEFGVYAWDAKSAERGLDQPIKVNDHAMDAIRYFVRTRHLVAKSGK